MVVHELAKRVGQDSKEIAELLGKNTIQNKVTDEDITLVVEKYGESGEAKSDVTAKTVATNQKDDTKKDLVLIWSENKKHTFQTSILGTDLYIENWKIVVERDSIAYKELIAHHDPDVRIVIDNPFKDTGERARFGKFLMGKVKTGSMQEESLFDGIGFVMAMMWTKEREEVAKLLNTDGVDAVVQYAVDHKSYIQT